MADRPIFGVTPPPPAAKPKDGQIEVGWNPACLHVRHMSVDDAPLELPLSPRLVYGLMTRAEATARLGECDACRPAEQPSLW
jgi:hypothetical protein